MDTVILVVCCSLMSFSLGALLVKKSESRIAKSLGYTWENYKDMAKMNRELRAELTDMTIALMQTCKEKCEGESKRC